jgi:hypothetical protein
MTVMPRGDYIDIAALLGRHKNPHAAQYCQKENYYRKQLSVDVL